MLPDTTKNKDINSKPFEFKSAGLDAREKSFDKIYAQGDFPTPNPHSASFMSKFMLKFIKILKS